MSRLQYRPPMTPFFSSHFQQDGRYEAEHHFHDGRIWGGCLCDAASNRVTFPASRRGAYAVRSYVPTLQVLL